MLTLRYFPLILVNSFRHWRHSNAILSFEFASALKIMLRFVRFFFIYTFFLITYDVMAINYKDV